MKPAPFMTRRTLVHFAIAGGVAGAGAILTSFLFAWLTSFSSGFTGLSGLGDALVAAALLSYAVLPLAVIFAVIALKAYREKPALPTALLMSAGAYAVFVLLRAAGLDAATLVLVAGLLSAVWGAGAGFAVVTLRSQPIAYAVAIVAVAVSFTLIGFVAEPIAKAAEKRSQDQRTANRYAQVDLFTKYVAPTRESGPRLTHGDGGIEFTATPFIVVRESDVIDGQEASIAPPYNCHVKLLSDVLQGEDQSAYLYKPELKGGDMPICHKIGLTKDNKPIYQQDPTTTDGTFYYYTRIQQTNIILTAPIGYVVDPGVDVNKEILDIVNSLQPYDGPVAEARY